MDIYQFKSNFLFELFYQLPAERDKIYTFNGVMTLAGKEHLRWSSKIDWCWNELERRSPKLSIPHQMNFRPLTHRITLADWLIEWVNNYPEGMFGQSLRTVMPQSRFRAIKIWCNLLDQGGTYWHSMFVLLQHWYLKTSANFEYIEWIVNKENVQIIITLKCKAFHSIKTLNIKDTEYPFWIITFQSESNQYLSHASNPALLTAQLGLQQGGNHFIPVTINNGSLTLALKIPRADTGSGVFTDSFVVDSVMYQIIDYIVSLVHPWYIEASECLEGALLAEINQVESHIRDIEHSWVIDDIKDLLNVLAFRRKLLNTLASNNYELMVYILTKGLNSKSRNVRIEAITGLEDLKDATTVPSIINALNDKEPSVCLGAARALNKIGTLEALAAIEKWQF
ncbi:MAG: HEAT repeat domain-containing protein [Deltaproteobacteria bacterium]|nr:HEAT repeat domain-containing protein [Deltaproteobacteria bacterium]